MKRFLVLIPLLFALIAMPVFAATETTVKTTDNAKLGTILTDAKRMTLYRFEKDTPGKSACYDKCATNWPAFTASEPLTLPDGVPGKLGLITRTDGTKQVTYNDMPLYHFAADKQAGDTKGQDVGNVWHVVNPSAPGATPAASPEATPKY